MRALVRRANKGFTLIELMIVVAIIGVLSVLGIYGVRKYIANAKSAEARANLGQIAKGVSAAYSRETMAGAVLPQGSSTAALKSLCLTAASVPATVPAATKYQSQTSDWSGTGWSCLRFVLDSPQYYQYTYLSDATATTAGTTFVAKAVGDLDNNTIQSTFTQNGKITSGVLNIAPTITETNPDE